ncbi:hypothetical protein M0R45_030932 [Rubus argutus]|uniref:Uncharacterized protein n=1 Tax=Rubus argutus TaxID=59490 RepID=A0AAW1WG14_RUBAR
MPATLIVQFCPCRRHCTVATACVLPLSSLPSQLSPLPRKPISALLPATPTILTFRHAADDVSFSAHPSQASSPTVAKRLPRLVVFCFVASPRSDRRPNLPAKSRKPSRVLPCPARTRSLSLLKTEPSPCSILLRDAPEPSSARCAQSTDPAVQAIAAAPPPCRSSPPLLFFQPPSIPKLLTAGVVT